jgi:hypothetical protein
MAIVTPWPSWSVLLRRIVDPQAVLGFLKVGHVQRDQLGTAERAAETHQEQRPVPQALEACRRRAGHVPQDLGDGGRLALRRRADRVRVLAAQTEKSRQEYEKSCLEEAKAKGRDIGNDPFIKDLCHDPSTSNLLHFDK